MMTTTKYCWCVLSLVLSFVAVLWIGGAPVAAAAEVGQVVSVEYQDLAAAFAAADDNDHPNNHDDNNIAAAACPQHLLTAVSEAFGPNGLGLLEIANVPKRVVELRSTVLSLAPQLAHLPAEALDDLTLPDQDFTIGWSHGKEQFGVDDATGQPMYDTRKGSFYLDPFRPDKNVFPQTSLPSLEPALLEVTNAMSQAALWVSKLCDAYLLQQRNQQSGDDDDMIYKSLESRVNTKARLLYYFPNERQAESSKKDDDDWCGWHKDHGSLTVLLPGMIWKDNDDEQSSSSSSKNNNNKNNNKHEKPGLYIQTRDGTPIHVHLPPSSIGIQVGETVEIMSGGRLVATPHAVMSKGVPLLGGRASLAVFLQPEPDQSLPECPSTADDSLRTRHRSTFGAFQQATTKAFQ